MAAKIDIPKALKQYEENKRYIGMALHMLTKTPAALRKDVTLIQARGHEDKLPADAVERLASDFDTIADECEAFCELLRSCSARLTAVRLGFT